MTVSTTATRVIYTGDNTTVTFAAPFKFLADSDLAVTLRATATSLDTVMTLTTHYTVSGAGSISGGSVTFGTPPTSTQTVIIHNNTPLTQAVDYVSGDAFPAETHELALDKLTLQQQRTRALAEPLMNSDRLNFGSIAAGEHADLTITVTGALFCDPVVLGISQESATGGSVHDHVMFMAFVSAANTVTVRCLNIGSAATDRLPGEFRVSVYPASLWNH